MVEISNLPSSPGVYIYRNIDDEIIYVGKAINLKKRISQYFQRDDALGSKTKSLVAQINTIETRIVGSEIEALVLESSLIKKYKPKYNSLMRDDKSYSFIVITKEKFPKVYSSHVSGIPKDAYFYGPFPSGMSVKTLLKTLRRIFPFYTKTHPSKTCLYCHLGICPGPNPDRSHYLNNIGKIKKVLSGKFSLLRNQLKKEMNMASKEEDYEMALEARNQMAALDYIVSGWHNLRGMFDTIELPDDRNSSAVNELKLALSEFFLNINPHRIECFDISQMGNKYFVGSMTVAIDGSLNHDQYRKFKIYTKTESPDDQFMIREVLWRRLRHPEWGLPDLIVVDGGKPQVSSAIQVTNDRPTIGLAKKNETIVIKSQDEFIEINLPKNSHALQLLQRLRDEAHRFANKYRKELMRKSLGQ